MKERKDEGWERKQVDTNRNRWKIYEKKSDVVKDEKKQHEFERDKT